MSGDAGTELYEWWKKGLYNPYDTEEAAELIAQVKEMIPPWVRPMRAHREFPVQQIVAGVKNGNLRELALKRLQDRKRCRCIRCREVGHRTLKEKIAVDPERIRTFLAEYEASDGKELFISLEEPGTDVLIGYLRLRLPSQRHTDQRSMNRRQSYHELHVYGPEVPVGRRYSGAWQHTGFGHTLLSEAESVARDRGAKMALIIGA